MTSVSSVHEVGHPKPVLWHKLERWGGEGCGGGVQNGGIHVYLWPILVHVWQKPSQYCKVIIFQLKLFKLKKQKVSRDLTRFMSQNGECVYLLRDEEGNTKVAKWLPERIFIFYPHEIWGARLRQKPPNPPGKPRSTLQKRKRKKEERQVLVKHPLSVSVSLCSCFSGVSKNSPLPLYEKDANCLAFW